MKEGLEIVLTFIGIGFLSLTFTKNIGRGLLIASIICLLLDIGLLYSVSQTTFDPYRHSSHRRF